MISVVIAGGKGTRLWPLSTSSKPKHVIDIKGKSYLQRAYERAKTVGEEVYVVTDGSHSELVADQLSELSTDHLIVEPMRRGTASCIALALAEIAKQHGEDAQVAFFHADHHIEDNHAFAATVETAMAASVQEQKIALIGLTPTHPATGFGYIKKGALLGESAYATDLFREKPDLSTAKQYVESGEYLWNLGLFAAPISVFAAAMAADAPGLCNAYKSLQASKDIERDYAQLEDAPIDTVLIEKTPTVVVAADFAWKDVGSYVDLYDVLAEDADGEGNVVVGDDRTAFIDGANNLVVTGGEPVAIVGLSNIAVIDTPDGLLVCDLNRAQAVKQAAQAINQ